MPRELVIPDNREGFSMKVTGKSLIRPDLQNIADELTINPKDVLYENRLLTVYNTSKECQEIVDDNNLIAFVAMALDIPMENISELTPVKAKPKIIEVEDIDEE